MLFYPSQNWVITQNWESSDFPSNSQQTKATAGPLSL